LSLTRAPIEPIQRVLKCMRKHGFPIVHTREGHRPDLADCKPNKLWRSKQIGAEIGMQGPLGRILITGEPGWEIIDELKPFKGEIIIDKPGHSALIATNLDLILRSQGICNLIVTGVTTDVCVHSTIRNANDLGYECLLLGDCCAATSQKNHDAAVDMIQMEGGIFGAVSNSNKLIAALDQSLLKKRKIEESSS
jgi:nicotinamidase-related amidase